jgi:hypothetical protein
VLLLLPPPRHVRNATMIVRQPTPVRIAVTKPLIWNTVTSTHVVTRRRWYVLFSLVAVLWLWLWLQTQLLLLYPV